MTSQISYTNDLTDQEEVDVVVDVAGPTTGRYFTTGDFEFLRIESQGDWTIEAVPAALADIPLWAEGTYTGSGNDVVRYTGEPGLLSYSDVDDPNIASARMDPTPAQCSSRSSPTEHGRSPSNRCPDQQPQGRTQDGDPTLECRVAR
jgi:hypothetical protein